MQHCTVVGGCINGITGFIRQSYMFVLFTKQDRGSLHSVIMTVEPAQGREQDTDCTSGIMLPAGGS